MSAETWQQQEQRVTASLAAALDELGGPTGDARVIDIPDWLMLRATWLRDFGEDW